MIMTRYFQLLNVVLNDLYLYNNANNFSIPNSLVYLNQPYVNELIIMIYDFINNTMNLICQNILNEINNIIRSNVNLNMIIFIVFLVFVISGYLIIWLPFESRLKDDVCRNH